MIGQRWCRVVFALAAALTAAAGGVGAQGGWSAQLVVSPLPSPYLSDWEIDPTIGELIVTNSSASTTDATLHYTLIWNGRLLLRGATDPQTIPAGESVTFNANSDVGGQADWDRDFQDLVARTGRLPEGEYEGCATIVDPGGLVLVDRQCIRFATLYPDPPHLVFPFDRDTVTTQDPIFEWQPVQLPALEGLRLGYVLAIAEVNTEARQLPEVALESNILHYVEPDLVETHHQYPVGALPLMPGRTYAWRVQALDGDGRPVAANQGRSEVWTFVYREPEAEVERSVATIELTPRRDTLRFPGDTARFRATAYDEDNVEIFGQRFEWRSTDTTVAKVDSAGVVRAVGAGEARIIAGIAQVADTAFSFGAGGGTGALITFYDPETETSQIEQFFAGSFEESAALAGSLVQTGGFTLRLPHVAARAEGDGNSAGCGDRGSPIKFHPDLERKAWAMELEAPGAAILDCLGLEAFAPTPGEPLKLFLVVSWAEGGVPDAFVAIVPPQFGLLDRTKLEYAVFVVNLFRDAGIDPAVVPEDIAHYFGSQAVASRPAGDDHQDQGGSSGWWSLSFHGALVFEEDGIMGRFLDLLNYPERRVQLEGFFGSAGGTTELRKTTRMHELAITGFLPTRTYEAGLELPLGWLTVDSTRFGVQLKFSDSLEVRYASPKDSLKGNPTLTVSAVLSLWVSTSRGHATEFVGTVGVDKWDDQKAVATLQADAVLPLWIARLGNPQLVLTLGLPAPLGVAKSAKGEGSLGLSAGFGFGKAGGGGPAGLESIGLASITAKWEPYDAKKADSARSAVRRSTSSAPPVTSVRDLPEFKAQADASAEHRAALDSLNKWITEGDFFSGADGGEPDDLARSAKWRAANRKVFEWQSLAHSLKAVWEEKWRSYDQALATWQQQRDEARPARPSELRRPRQECPGTGTRIGNKCYSFSFSLSLQHMSLRSLLGDVVGLLVDEARSQ